MNLLKERIVPSYEIMTFLWVFNKRIVNGIRLEFFMFLIDSHDRISFNKDIRELIGFIEIFSIFIGERLM